MGDVVFLVDSSVWLEILLEQDAHEEARAFLSALSPGQAAMSEFTLYSIGIILTRHGRGEAFRRFLTDTVLQGAVERVRLGVEGLDTIVDVLQEEQLDFDDAYQYVAAQKVGAKIVSLDGDFDETSDGRLSPQQALEQLTGPG